MWLRWLVLSLTLVGGCWACNCEQDEFALETHPNTTNVGPLGRQGDQETVVLESLPNPDRDSLPHNLQGDTAAADSAGVCVCRRARKPNRNVRCDKPGTALHTEGGEQHDPCADQEVPLLPVAGLPALKVVGKLGFKTNTPSALRVPELWEARWSEGVVDALSRVSGIPHLHIAIPRIRYNPTTADFSIAINNHVQAAENIVGAVQEGIAAGTFDTILATHTFPPNTHTTLLSISAKSIRVYEPMRHKVSLQPLRPLEHQRVGNHTVRVNATAVPAVLASARSVVVEAVGSGARAGEEEVPLALKNGIPIDKRCGKPKKPSKLAVPPVLRGQTTVGVRNPIHDDLTPFFPDDVMAKIQPGDTGNLPEPSNPSAPPLWGQLASLEARDEALAAQEKRLLAQIAQLEAKLPENAD